MRGCHLILLLALFSGCATTPVQEGALVGGAFGAGLGAVAGHQMGRHSGQGALIGGAVGALAGALVGDLDAHSRPARVVSAPPPPRVHAVPGHYESRLRRAENGETYEERIWIPGS